MAATRPDAPPCRASSAAVACRRDCCPFRTSSASRSISIGRGDHRMRRSTLVAVALALYVIGTGSSSVSRGVERTAVSPADAFARLQAGWGGLAADVEGRCAAHPFEIRVGGHVLGCTHGPDPMPDDVRDAGRVDLADLRERAATLEPRGRSPAATGRSRASGPGRAACGRSRSTRTRPAPGRATTRSRRSSGRGRTRSTRSSTSVPGRPAGHGTCAGSTTPAAPSRCARWHSRRPPSSGARMTRSPR